MDASYSSAFLEFGRKICRELGVPHDYDILEDAYNRSFLGREKIADSVIKVCLTGEDGMLRRGIKTFTKEEVAQSILMEYEGRMSDREIERIAEVFFESVLVKRDYGDVQAVFTKYANHRIRETQFRN